MANTMLLLTLLVMLGGFMVTTAKVALRSVDEIQRRLARMEYQAVMAPALPPSCYIENGFDYVDNDLKNVPGPTAESCCWECYITPDCQAYSWTSQNSGTCWLKRGRGQIVVNPNVKSSIVLFGSNPVCQISYDLDYVGNDLDRISGKVEDCCEICHNYLGCRAYSWSDYLGGSCWLKSAKGNTIYKVGVKSAEAYPSGGGVEICSLQADTDYVDNDIGTASSPTAGGCCKICKDRADCRAFAWTSQGGGTCWLKSMKGTVIYKPGVTSAQVRDNPVSTCTLEVDVDYVDNDIDNKPGKDATKCCTICKDYGSACKAFSWSNHNGGTCWLKSAKGQSISKSGVTSAVV